MLMLNKPQMHADVKDFLICYGHTPARLALLSWRAGVCVRVGLWLT